MNYNKVLVAGRLTRDPEIKYTPKGTALATISLAVNRNWTNEAGEKKEEVTFVDVEVWGKQAEAIGQYLAKGSPLFIEGRLKLDQWDDKESGQKRSKLKVVCEGFQFISTKGGGGAESQESAPRAAARPAGKPASDGGGAPAGESDDNIPF